MPAQIKPAYAGEAMLLRWGDTHSSGRTITIQLDEHVGEQHPFKGLRCGPNGQRMQICAVLIDENEQPQNPKTFSAEPLPAPEGALTENGPDTGLASANAGGRPTTTLAQGQGKREYSRSQIAALKIREWVFREWMEHSGLFPGWAPNRLQDDPDDRLQVQTADAALKDVLGISSKSELDTPGPVQDKWDRLLASYDFKDQVQA